MQAEIGSLARTEHREESKMEDLVDMFMGRSPLSPQREEGERHDTIESSQDYH